MGSDGIQTQICMILTGHRVASETAGGKKGRHPRTRDCLLGRENPEVFLRGGTGNRTLQSRRILQCAGDGVELVHQKPRRAQNLGVNWDA